MGSAPITVSQKIRLRHLCLPGVNSKQLSYPLPLHCFLKSHPIPSTIATGGQLSFFFFFFYKGIKFTVKTNHSQSRFSALPPPTGQKFAFIYLFILFIYFELWSHVPKTDLEMVTKNDLELLILLSLPPNCWPAKKLKIPADSILKG